VDARTHGYLADHAPAGTPVLPLALAAEWLMAATQARSLRELRVLSRIDLPDLATGHRFTIERDQVEVRLTSPGNRAHYRALLSTSDTLVERPWPTITGSPVDPVYGNPALFHAPRFQALQRLDAISADGADARVLGVRAMGWPGGPWWTDPAAVDATLPMGVNMLRVHRTGPAPGPLRCLVRATAVSDGQSSCDIILLDEDAEPRAELLGVSMIRRPDLAATSNLTIRGAR
jgi:hypothetical protein